MAAVLLMIALSIQQGADAAIAPQGADAAIAPQGADAIAPLAERLSLAGENRARIEAALAQASPEVRPHFEWLLQTMPKEDLPALDGEYLLRNCQLAVEAWRAAPWGKEIPEAMFRQYILPYACLNERRDDWRKDFLDRFRKLAWESPDLITAVRRINDALPGMLDVHFSAEKRKKPDQSPYESMEIGYASCTGLSILMVDACRAVGIPARVTGCPAWKVVQGNHNWVEVWSDAWHNVGDTGSDPRDDDWVNERCRTETDPEDWSHAVYATVWKPTGIKFPLVWAFEIEYVPARNVTRFYTAPTVVEVPVEGGALVEAYWHGELVARARGSGGSDAAPIGSVRLPLAKGEQFEVITRATDGSVTRSTITP